MHLLRKRYANNAALVAAALILASAGDVYGQIDAGKAGKSETATPPRSASAPTSPSQQSRLTPQSLIGDAVGDPASPQYQDVADAIKKAVNGDGIGARESLESAVKKNPNLPPAGVLMAKVLSMANQIPAARIELEKAVRDAPNDPEAYMLFAQSALQERRITDAELLLLKAKTLSDAYQGNAKRKRNFDINITSGLALVAEAREQWDVAIAQLRKWLELDPDSVIARQRLGVDLFRQGKGETKAAENAYKEFQAAMAIDPKANAEITLAELYQTTGASTNAKRWIDFAVQKYPKELRVQLAAAQLAAQGNRLDEAQKFADSAIKIDPESSDAKLLRASIARLAGDLTTAESLLEQVHLQSPSNVAAANLLAQVLVDQGDTKKQTRGLELAKMNLQAATEGNKTNRDLLAAYGWALFRNGQTATAEQVMAQVVNSGQLGQDYAYYVAKMLLEPRGKYPEAIRLLEEILKNPQPFAYRLQASDLLNELKKKPPPTSTPATETAVPPIVPEVSPSPAPSTLPGAPRSP
jgi:tetratricopeptide (TPR) repeat protein